ncbi:homogentisate phytyltransferase 1, chloroplastic-like [Humulus lupulus]|uniref:homogentisate phytyltransferase 1, chloroplastic-like n=1 Tax=Humulus lupulus TaxID=3486 RepID=UPI002B401EA4|nr:homogentisate phytyltransferase 1, chloroplastic-like [Humulus lupulus]
MKYFFYVFFSFFENAGSNAAYNVSRFIAWNVREKHCCAGLQPSSLKHCIETSISYQRPNKRFLVNAADGQPLESEPKNVLNSVKDSLDAFYRFSRPHTVIGTALSIVSVSLLAVEKLTDFSPLFFAGMLEAVAAAFLMNIYIVGLNQLYDIDIDKVNKPYLPLASGEYSIQTGVMIVTSFFVLSFGLGWIVGSWPLFWALFISFALGTAYSINVPLLRWKRSALVAAMCILAVRAVIVQLSFFLHMQVMLYLFLLLQAKLNFGCLFLLILCMIQTFLFLVPKADCLLIKISFHYAIYCMDIN